MTAQELIDKVCAYYPAADAGLMRRAYDFSARVHQGQRRQRERGIIGQRRRQTRRTIGIPALDGLAQQQEQVLHERHVLIILSEHLS